jgi:hypothetical protein
MRLLGSDSETNRALDYFPFFQSDLYKRNGPSPGGSWSRTSDLEECRTGKAGTIPMWVRYPPKPLNSVLESKRLNWPPASTAPDCPHSPAQRPCHARKENGLSRGGLRPHWWLSEMCQGRRHDFGSRAHVNAGSLASRLKNSDNGLAFKKRRS